MSDEQQLQLTQLASKAAATKGVYDKTRAFVADAVAFVIGFTEMALALYFFADGPKLLKEAQELSPRENEDEDVLLEHFDKVCRGVVVGTIVSAVVQDILAGIGFAIVGIDWLWLAAAVAVFFSFIPFRGV